MIPNRIILFTSSTQMVRLQRLTNPCRAVPQRFVPRPVLTHTDAQKVLFM